jgi:hypothetical protein
MGQTAVCLALLVLENYIRGSGRPFSGLGYPVEEKMSVTCNTPTIIRIYIRLEIKGYLPVES